MLIASSVVDMQSMLNICTREADNLDMGFNVDKSVALRIGPRYKASCSSLFLSAKEMKYVDNVKYLGVHVSSGAQFVCSFSHCKLAFYRVLNSLYAKSNAAQSKLVSVHLLKTFCIPLIH